MPRPSKRDDLVATGVEIMQRRGYASASAQDIAEAAGVPKGSFFNHFGSKEDFALEVVDRYVASGLAGITALLAEPGQSPQGRLQRFIDWHTQQMTNMQGPRGCLLGNLSLEALTFSDNLRQRIAKGFHAWRDELARLIAAGQADGSFTATLPPADLADMVLSLAQGALMRAKVEPGDRHPGLLDVAVRRLVGAA